MNRFVLVSLGVVMLVSILVQPLFAQRTRPPFRPPRTPGKTEPQKFPPLPNDERLLALHLEFVKKAEKLAQEYEHNKELDKALDVYQEILKLVPQYPPARSRYQELKKLEATANKATITIKANEAWQDTGITVLPGKPVTIRAAGTWTFNLSSEMGPAGLKIPSELKGFNLGSLIGMVHSPTVKTPKAFTVGAAHTFKADRKGRLMLRMFDIQPEDNKGTITVEVIGTFEK